MIQFFLFLVLSTASAQDIRHVELLPIQNNGRVKPFHTLARESTLFITGKYKFKNHDSTSFYFGLITDPILKDAEFVNVRSPEIRKKLGLEKDRRYFSLKELSLIPMEAMVQPLFEKDAKLLTPDEKSLIEVFHQYRLSLSISSGDHFIEATNFLTSESPRVSATARSYLEKLNSNNSQELRTLDSTIRQQNMPELFKEQLPKVPLEILYNKTHLFLLSAISFLILGLLVLFYKSKKSKMIISAVFLAAFLFLVSGFALRVYITGFAPVTNMYGTMLWVSLGVGLFTFLLYKLYDDRKLVGALWLGCSIILFLTESLPLSLSPDMDPIVAVLRNNFWLTIHVLTITISYAAFTITMIIGNNYIIQSFFRKTDAKTLKNAAHSVYRMIQLGVFLLTIGIILGGIWADYSWGRFWGWDPKETWALIADLGFLAILHSRYLGWLGDFGLMVSAPAAYLLVVMAWYGVNFILASGLHSYGFSSGGAAAIFSFVAIQILILSAALARKYLKTK